MVSLIKAKKAEVGEGILGEFLADSKEDTLPTEVEWKRERFYQGQFATLLHLMYALWPMISHGGRGYDG